MATVNLTSSRSSIPEAGGRIYYVNEHQPTATGESVIFINGMNHNADAALRLTKQISHAVNDSRIVCFHNHTLDMSARLIKVGPEEVDAAIEYLKELILGEISYFRRSMEEQIESIGRIRVLVLAHSHGAHLIDRAMNAPELVEQKNNIEIATFGGISTLPRNLARKVENYINSLDLAPVCSQLELDLSKSTKAEAFVGNLLSFGQEKLLSEFLGRAGFRNQEVAKLISQHQALQCKIDQGCDRFKAVVSVVENTLMQIAKETEQTCGSNSESWIQFFGGTLQALGTFCMYHVECITPPGADGPFEHHSMKAYIPVAVRVINNR